MCYFRGVTFASHRHTGFVLAVKFPEKLFSRILRPPPFQRKPFSLSVWRPFDVIWWPLTKAFVTGADCISSVCVWYYYIISRVYSACRSGCVRDRVAAAAMEGVETTAAAAAAVLDDHQTVDRSTSRSRPAVLLRHRSCTVRVSCPRRVFLLAAAALSLSSSARRLEHADIKRVSIIVRGQITGDGHDRVRDV